MTTSEQLSEHFHQVFFGDNWTAVNLKTVLSNVAWQEANKKNEDCNSIADLTFHINYFVNAILNVLEGNVLNAHDKYSYDTPAIKSENEWNVLKENGFTNAEKLVELISQLPEKQLQMPFEQEKYGTYHRNLLGLIEHTHYHLGQISLLKKMLKKDKD